MAADGGPLRQLERARSETPASVSLLVHASSQPTSSWLVYLLLGVWSSIDRFLYVHWSCFNWNPLYALYCCWMSLWKVLNAWFHLWLFIKPPSDLECREQDKQTERSLVVPTSQGSNPGICTQNNPPRCARWLGLLRRWPRLRCAAPACVLRWSPAQVQFVPCGHGTGFRGGFSTGVLRSLLNAMPWGRFFPHRSSFLYFFISASTIWNKNMEKLSMYHCVWRAFQLYDSGSPLTKLPLIRLWSFPV